MATNTSGVDVVLKGTVNGDSYYHNLHIAVAAFWMVLPMPAIVTNIINIKVFLSIGINDGVSVSFLALSFSDLLYSVASFMIGCSQLSAKLEVMYGIVFPANPVALIIYSYLSALAAYPITGLSTTYLAVARCMCVVRPLQFKNVFTKRRSTAMHIFFAVFSLLSYSTIYTQMSIKDAYDPFMNLTRGMLTYTEYRDVVKDVVVFMFDTVIAFTTQILMILCVIIMAHSLRKSLQFRQGTQVSTKGELSDEGGNKLSGKELTVVKQVVLICVVYTICSLPKMLIAVFNFALPGFLHGGSLSDVYYDLHLLRNGFEIINGGTTMFIYYLFNSKFRAFLCGRKTA